MRGKYVSDVEPAGPKPIFAPAGMSATLVMPDDAKVVIENGVWYIGNIAQAFVICRPGAIGLLPEIDSAAGPIVVIPNGRSPVCTSAMFCIGPPVTSAPPATPVASDTIPAQPEP